MNSFYLLSLSFGYITHIPYFWASMGFTSAISMLVTAMLFDHDFRIIAKAFTAKMVFIFMLFLVTFTRVDYGIRNHLIDLKITPYQPYAGIATLLLTTLFWVIGMLLAYLILKFQEVKWSNL